MGLLMVTFVTTYHMFIRAFLLASYGFMKVHVASPTISADCLRYAWNELSKSKKLFDSWASSFAAMLSLGSFSGLLLSLTLYSKGRLQWPDTMLFAYHTSVNFVLFMSIIVHVDYANSQLKGCYNQYRDQVIRQRYGITHDELLADMEDNYGLDFTVYNAFNLDRSFALTYIAALVNFTVVFIQVTPS
ncbi:hypothetical protein HDE_12179 [Halotydeus destructor]|nr:hypothetical protein HDE_12179 [Halotydeus destructor]